MIVSNHNRVSEAHAVPPGQIQCPGVQHSSTSKVVSQKFRKMVFHSDESSFL